MSLSYVRYVADGSTDEFDVPFPVQNRTHLKVTINGAPPVLPIRWTGESRIKIADNIAAGSKIELRRQTPISSRLVDFQNGSVLTEEELDTAINQVFYLQQELKDLYEDTLAGRLAEIGGDWPEGTDMVDRLARYVINSEAAQQLAQAVADIAVAGDNIAALAFDTGQLDTALDQANGAIAANEQALVDAQTSLSETISTVDTRVSTLRNDHEQLVDLVDALAGGDPGTGVATLIQDETNARIAGDEAIVDTIDLIGAKSGDNLSFIIDMNTAKVSPTESLAQRFSALSATDANNAAAILTEQTARITEDEALAQSITLLDTRVGSAEASILTEQTARADGDSANAQSIDALRVRMDTAEADIVSEQNARVSGDSALTTSLNALTARVTTTEGDISSIQADVISEQQARADADGALTSNLNALSARVTTAEGDIADNAAAIIAEQQARADAISAEASARTTLTATVNTKNRTFRQSSTPTAAAVGDLWYNTGNNNQLKRWSGSSWVATDDTRIAANTAAIVNEQNVRASETSALTSSLNALISRVDTAEAAIVTEQNTRASADGALTTQYNGLVARMDTAEDDIASNLAAIQTEQSARVSADSALTTQLNTLGSRVGTAEAAIVTEEQARVNGDNANAQSISTLQTTVNGHSSSITTLQQTTNGLSARYGVALNVNGHITGFVQNNDGQEGGFTVLADRFSIVDPNGGQPFIPFEIIDGLTYIDSAMIRELSVGRLTTGVLTAGITQNADWQVGTGRIIWDNGTYMKVAGVGFGTQSQFIEWFGPKMAINQCSEANAIQYLKTNGDAYFGGTLSAGILKNSATATSTAADAYVTVGPFGTNGDPIKVVCSYAIQSGYTANYNADSTGESQWDSAIASWGATRKGTLGDYYVDETKSISCNVSVRLDRAIGASNTVGFATLNITSGTERISGNRPNRLDMVSGYLTFTRTVSGSITTTDNAGGTTDRSFTASITTRTGATTGSIQYQRVAIVATEE